MSRNLLLALATAGAMAGFSLPLAQQAPAQVAVEGRFNLEQEGVEPLTRGPLHEAFAEPVTAEADAALVVAKEPPAPIEEAAPEYRPTGEEAQWIPGYWGWDDERDDFIWISGVYRVAPPGQRFVPGYWQQVDRGWQWVPGFWIAANAEELTYQDPPPASLEQGPSSPSPGDDYFYVAGYWNNANNGYQWQPGYWYPSYSNYMWIPPRYIYTPRGCIFAGGHWDWRFGMRGQAFAPVYMQRSFYSRPGFVYRPAIALNNNLLFANLFIRPNYNHYFFGDYYGNQYARRNIVPAYAYHTRRGGYDPMMAYYSAYYRRQGEDFIGSQRDWHDRKVRDASQRPSQNWADLVQRSGRGGANNRQSLIAEPLAQLAQGRDGQTQFVKIDDRQRDQLSTQSKAWREMARERGQAEKIARADGAPGTRPGAARDPKAKVELHGKMKLPPAMESRVTARVNPDDPNARDPGDVGRGRGRDVPPPAQPDAGNVREDLRKLPDNATNPRTRPDRPNVPGADAPGTRPEVPGTRPEVPRERPNVPGTDTPRPGTGVPSTEVPNTPNTRPEVPRTRPEVPRERPNVPGADTPRPGTGTPGAEVPKTRPEVPGTRPEVPRERLNVPGTDAPRPVPGTEVPGTRQQYPRGEVPRERPNVPGTDAPRPTTPGADVPRTRPEVPRERPNVPGADTPRPNAPKPETPRTEAPRTRPEVPRERPNVPGANTPRPETPRTEAPRTRPEVPRERPMNPAARPEAPRTRPETPRAERPQPPARPATPPAARPERPQPPARPATPPAAAPRPERQPRAERPQPPARQERPQPQPKAEPPKEDKGKGKGKN